jgi:pachytene checkpoint protein 2
VTHQRLAPVPALEHLPTGIQRIRALPDPDLEALWASIVTEPQFKDRLVGQAVLNFTLRRRVKRSVVPLHGVILLTGEPGTGKTSLARGLASRISSILQGSKGFRLLEVEPHALTSSAMGRTQRAVSDLFAQAIAEAATVGPTVVLLDEVETLAADRTKLSLEANPIDIHRATDAVLVQLDALADEYPDLLFVATSNFPAAVDSAFTSRCDLVLEVPLPDRSACKQILSDCLEGLGAEFPAIGKLARSPSLEACADACAGLDGRAIRKGVAAAMASDLQVAADPNKLTAEQLRTTLAAVRRNRSGAPRP